MPIVFKTEEERNPTKPIVTPAILEAKEKHNPSTTGNKVSFDEPTVVEENLTQDIFAEGEEEKLAIQFIEENALYTKFMLWCGLQEQLKKLKDELAN